MKILDWCILELNVCHNKNLSNNYVLARKKIFLVITKKYNFTINLHLFWCLHKTKKRIFKKNLCVYISYATLVIYVSVFRAEQFQFPFRVIFYGFSAEDGHTGFNWFRFVIQTAKPSTKEESFSFGFQVCWI